ncbi:MAG: hypothetical protein K0U41_06565 [Gammaproteobacteria bacterium]|nr:hypothetical protein [Gammaproteobacteria bacterium]
MTHRYTKKQLVSFICDFLAHTEGAGAVCEARVAIANTAMALEIMRADKIQTKYDRDFKKFSHLLNLEED